MTSYHVINLWPKRRKLSKLTKNIKADFLKISRKIKKTDCTQKEKMKEKHGLTIQLKLIKLSGKFCVGPPVMLQSSISENCTDMWVASCRLAWCHLRLPISVVDRSHINYYHFLKSPTFFIMRNFLRFYIYLLINRGLIWILHTFFKWILSENNKC